jgi:hypothetical protein
VGIATLFAADSAQAKASLAVKGGGVSAAIIKHQIFRLAVFQKQLPPIGQTQGFGNRIAGGGQR